jgi:hypothetical protein
MRPVAFSIFEGLPMTRSLLALATALSVTLPAPAAAATWAFGGTGGNVASVTATAEGVTMVARARRFDASLAPNGLTNLSQLTGLSSSNTAMTVNQTLPGIGITGGASTPQIDTNQPAQREAMLISLSNSVSLKGLKLSYIDNDDTLQIYGVNANGSLTSLGFGGIIETGLAGAATAVNTNVNDGTTVLTFLNNQITAYNRFVFTTRIAGQPVGQGYRIDTITAEILPEPGS